MGWRYCSGSYIPERQAQQPGFDHSNQKMNGLSMVLLWQPSAILGTRKQMKRMTNVFGMTT